MADFYEDKQLTMKQFLVVLTIGYVLDAIPDLLEVRRVEGFSDGSRCRQFLQTRGCCTMGRSAQGDSRFCLPWQFRSTITTPKHSMGIFRENVDTKRLLYEK